MFRKICVGSMIALGLATPAMAQTPPCAVIVGGGYELTGDASVNDTWLKANKMVSDDLTAALSQRGYTVREQFAASTSSDDSMKIAVSASRDTGCSEIIQLTTFLKDPPDAVSPGRFGFAATVVHFDIQHANGFASYNTVIDASKTYEYPRTMETFQTLSMSDVAAKIADDLDASSVLAGMKGAAPTP
jgi:hypothetical protein